jgi:hypothetical protein
MSTNQAALALLDPDEMNSQVTDLAQSAREQLDRAWAALNVDRNIEATNDALVAIDADVRRLRAFGEASAAALIVLQQDREILEQQRDQAIRDRASADERAELAEDHAERLIENMDGMVQQKVESEMMIAQMMWESAIDPAEIADEQEEAWLADLSARAACLRFEGQEADAAEMEQLIGAYLQARQAVIDGGQQAVVKLVEISNKRREAEGLDPEPWYKVPAELRGDSEDDDPEDDDDFEPDIDGTEFEDDEDA